MLWARVKTEHDSCPRTGAQECRNRDGQSKLALVRDRGYHRILPLPQCPVEDWRTYPLCLSVPMAKRGKARVTSQQCRRAGGKTLVCLSGMRNVADRHRMLCRTRACPVDSFCAFARTQESGGREAVRAWVVVARPLTVAQWHTHRSSPPRHHLSVEYVEYPCCSLHQPSVLGHGWVGVQWPACAQFSGIAAGACCWFLPD